jgi:glycosyl hydrolase family 35/beta-galactosidase-like protein
VVGRRLLRLFVVALVGLSACGSTHPALPARSGTIGLDRYSLILDGHRVFIWSGEFHPFRLPSPSLWPDVLEKMKAEGFNAVSIYFDWGYHSPAPGVYDFSGVRDMDRVLTDAQRAGLYVIARPGPYINAELDAGGFPGWLLTQAGHARTDAPDYLRAVDAWMRAIDRIIARHQFTNGTGTVIVDQIENELPVTAPAQVAYMRHLVARARADGITVPLAHNDRGRNGFWVPPSSTVAGTVAAPVNLYGFDDYPGGECTVSGAVGAPTVAQDWGIWGPGGATGGSSASPHTPGDVAEFGGGWFDPWGHRGGYACTAAREGSGYERVFYETNIANRLTLQNVYMAFGGTSWGWLPAPLVYSSYDYGAAIDEARQLRPKAATLKELGLFVQSVPELTRIDRVRVISRPGVRVYDDVNRLTGTHFYVVVHPGRGSATVRIPGFAAPVRLSGQDARMLVAGLPIAGQQLVSSTSELMSTVPGVLVLHGRFGQAGETALGYGSRPRVTVLHGAVRAAWDGHELSLDYVHRGLIEVAISGGGRPPALLLIADEASAATLWRPGSVLVRGPELVRSAAVSRDTVTLRGDTRTSEPLEVWAPAGVRRVVWNGGAVAVRRTSSGSLLAVSDLPGSAPVALPALSVWRYAGESPQARPRFNDAGWPLADHTRTNSTTPPPPGRPVLTADDYGFHHGDVWYRGHFNGSAMRIALRYGGGGSGLLQAWLDGRYLGQNVLPAAVTPALLAGTVGPPTIGTAIFAVHAGAGRHVLAVMVRNDGHNEDGLLRDTQKEGRGLIAVSGLPRVRWRIQGGRDSADPVRGPFNTGGLFGQRAGWSLTGYPDRGWPTVRLPAAGAIPGTAWYRTSFRLAVPAPDDASLGLTIAPSKGDYRALIFLNGWNMGQYIARVGPQHTFVLPAGVLDPRGVNTLAIAVTSNGGPGNGLARVSLTNLGTVAGGVPVALVNSPGYVGSRP